MRKRSTTLAETTPEQARQILEDAQRENLAIAQAEIEAVCKKRGCTLAAQIGVSQDGRIVANVVLTNAA